MEKYSGQTFNVPVMFVRTLSKTEPITYFAYSNISLAMLRHVADGRHGFAEKELPLIEAMADAHGWKIVETTQEND